MMSLSVIKVLPNAHQHQRNPQPWTDVSATKADQESESQLKPGSVLLKLMQKLNQKKKIYMDHIQSLEQK